MKNSQQSKNSQITRNTSRVCASFAAMSLLGSTLLATAGCRSPNFGSVFSMSKSQEVELGQQAAVQVERENRIVTSGPKYEQLQRVAARILPLARRDYDVPFSVKMIDNKEINAFALPGGPIYFYSGLLDLAATDDEVASVLGHEATHIVKRHSVKQISDAQTKGLIAQLALGKSGNLAQAAAGIALQIDRLKFSRGDESQSDEVGFKYMTQAGYNPEAMASFFRKMGAKTGKGGTEWLQSHPLTDNRVKAAEKRANEYQQGQGGTNAVK
ncbi:MAG: M48 family metalloprotease [Akkermansiaceae bacterium]|nr:M48 family metalloprotease [Armatimonadota bacterium]